MVKKIGGVVAVVVVVILVVSRCGSERVVRPYVDPFPQGMETAFAEAGLPIVASRINDNLGGVDHDVGIILQVDPEVCPAQDQECLEDLLKAQAWNDYVKPPISPSPRLVLAFGIFTEERCYATGGPAVEWKSMFDEYGYFPEVKSIEPHMWYFFLYC